MIPAIWINRARWNSILCGAVIFFWSGLEDNDLTAVTVLGIWLSISLITLWIISHNALPTSNRATWALIMGAGVGILTSLCVAGLMLFKNLRHSHVFPDYPFEMMRDILTRAPFWAIGGMCITFGIFLLARLFIKQAI